MNTSAEPAILIVDDSQDAAEAMAMMLGLMGFATVTALTVPAALEAVERVQPLCVLLDVNMPDMDGLDLARALRSRCGDDVILIAITGAGAEDARAAQTFAIVDHHFAKPVDVAALEQVLRH